MADNTAQIADSLKGINSSLESFTNLSKQMEERLANVADSSFGIRDDFTAIEKNQEKITKASKGWGLSLTGIVESSGKIANLFGSAVMLTGILDAFKASLSLDQSMKNLSARMGLGVKASKELYKNVTDVAFATGSTVEATSDMVSGLIRARVAMKDVKEAAGSMLIYSRVTGQTNDEAMQLYSTLNKVGGLGNKEVLKVATTFAQIQQKVGMTEQEMSMLSDSVSETAHRMSAFGRTPAEIQKMTIGTASLAAGFVKVGLSVQKATDLIDQLTDPTRLEDNIGLYSQLGISIQDAMSGNIDPNQMASGLDDFAQKVKGMGAIAGAQYAKTFGQNYNDLMKIANKTEDGLSDTMTEASTMDQSKSLEEMAKAQQGLQLTVEKFFNRINAFIVSLGPLLLGVAILVTTIILPRIFNKIRKESVDTSRTVADGIKGSLVMGIEKSWIATSTRVKKVATNISEDYKKRLVEGSEYAHAHMSADFINLQGTVNQLKIGKSFAKGAEDFTRWVAGSAKPASITSALITSMRDRQREMLDMDLRDKKIMDGKLQSQYEAYDNIVKESTQRRDILESMKKANTITIEQESELRQVEQILSDAKIGFERIEKKINESTTETQILDKHLRRMTNETLADINKKKREEISLTQQSVDQAIAKTNGLKEEKRILDTLGEKAKKQLETDMSKLSNEREMRSLSIEAIQDIQKRISSNKEIINQQSIMERTIKEEEAASSELIKDLERQKRIQGDISNIIAERGGNEAGTMGRINKGFNNVLRSFSGQVVSSLRSAAGDFADKIKNTRKTIIEGISTGFQTAMKHPMRTTVSGMSGLAGGIGNLTRVLGIAALGITFLTKIFGPAIDMLKNQLGPVFEEVMKALQPIANVLIKALLPPLLKLLAALLPPFFGLVKILSSVLTPILVGLMKMLKVLLGWLPGIGPTIGEFTDGLADTFTQVNDTLQTTDFSGIGTSLNKAADGISKSNITNDKLVNKAAEPAIYNATGGRGFTQTATGVAPVNNTAAKTAQEAQQQAVASTASTTAKTAENTDIMTKLLTRLNGTMDKVEKTLSDMALTAELNSTRAGLASAKSYNNVSGANRQ